MNKIWLFSVLFVLITASYTDIEEDIEEFLNEEGELNEKPTPGQIQDPDSIFDDLYLEGNKYTHKERIFDYRIGEKASQSPLKMELSADYFGGFIASHYPYYSPEVYRANVHDFKVQGSFNFTGNLKFEIMNMVKIDLEVNFVPLLLGFGISGYQSTALEELCFWIHEDFQGMTIQTTVTKNVKQCGKNIRDMIQDADSYLELSDQIEEEGWQMLQSFQCQYDEVEGPNRQQLDMLSGVFPTNIDFHRVTGGQCMKQLPRYTFIDEDKEDPIDEEYSEYVFNLF